MAWFSYEGCKGGKYESRNMPSAKSEMSQSRTITPVGLCNRETRRRSFGHRMVPSLQSLFWKILSESDALRPLWEFRQMWNNRRMGGGAREHPLRISFSIVWARVGENLNGQHACAFVKGGANCNDYLFNFNRSEVDRWSATRILISLSHSHCMHVSHTRRRLSLIVVALRNRCLRRVTPRRNDSLHWIAICRFNIASISLVRRVYVNLRSVSQMVPHNFNVVGYATSSFYYMRNGSFCKSVGVAYFAFWYS